ncbi:MAG: hypothetical protein L6R39_005878 [Caloplaca ligustica]|nr:MAG: hypothetical protein L6R39_005878 [Caloplaca ligustica]
MPRPRCRPTVVDDDYQDIAEDLWMNLKAHRGRNGDNPGRPGATRLQETLYNINQDLGRSLLPHYDLTNTGLGTERSTLEEDPEDTTPTLTPTASTVMAASMGGAPSPSHSPRLPSPPPFTEVQIGPQSPTSNVAPGASTQAHDDAVRYDQSATRRIRPGTKAADMASGPPLVPLDQLDSSFQLQEHLKALYASLTKPEKGKTTVPINAETAQQLAKAPDGVDPLLWLYELCRLLVILANNIIIGFYQEDPPCSKDTCPEMRASEWQYLCAVHDPPKACYAIDYCNHTLDWAANQLTSPKIFPSRLTLGSQTAGGSQGGLRALTNIMRRCYRIFAHAWYQHRQVFWNIENSQGLYIFFKTVCDVYNLIPQDSYTVPPEAEGLASTEEEPRSEPSRASVKPSEPETPKKDESDATTTISTGATTRRHKHTPSTGSAVTTIAEGDEDDKEHHSPDKDVPQDVLSSSALKASSSSVVKDKESEETSKDVEDAKASVRDVDLKDEGKEDSDVGNESEVSEAETVVHDA